MDHNRDQCVFSRQADCNTQTLAVEMSEGGPGMPLSLTHGIIFQYCARGWGREGILERTPTNLNKRYSIELYFCKEHERAFKKWRDMNSGSTILEGRPALGILKVRHPKCVPHCVVCPRLPHHRGLTSIQTQPHPHLYHSRSLCRFSTLIVLCSNY